MFNSYYDLMKLPHNEADLLVGEITTIKNRYCIIIELDEYFIDMSGFSTRYSVIQIYNTEIPKGITVGIPGIDDSNFNAFFDVSQTFYLSIIFEYIYSWANRNNFRKINAHALADYCLWLGAKNIEWN